MAEELTAAGKVEITEVELKHFQNLKAKDRAGEFDTTVIPDNTVRNLMAKEAMHAMRTDRERALASEGIEDDDEFVSMLLEHVEHRNLANLISLTARYAGELQHTLISPHKRKEYKNCKEDGYSGKNLYRKVIPLDTSWHMIVDPGLVGNARIACHDIMNVLPKFENLKVENVLQSSDEFVTLFAAVVAFRWRLHSVQGANVYKTLNEQNAVRVAHTEAIQFCKVYRTDESGRISRLPRRRAPTCIAEIPFEFQ